jgi:alkylation response protein AidB-like acyl-CoA dehydrogenase
MDFSRSEKEEEFIAHAEKVLKDEISPEYVKWKSENTTPRNMYEILGRNGLLGFTKEENEIHPIPWLQNIHFYSQTAQLSGGCAVAAFANSQLGLQALHYFGNEEQKSEFLNPGISGKKIFAFANTEPGAGSDAASISCRAEKNGEDYIINGTKAYITNGDIADHIIFTAVTHPEKERKHKRISMFIVNGDASNLKRKRLKKLGWAPSHLSTLKFEDVKIHKKNLIGELEKGFYQTMKIFNTSRIGISAMAHGTSLGAFRSAYGHVQNRTVFDKPLIEHQSKRNEFADNITKLQAGWLLVQKAAYLKDSNKEFRFNSSMAKLFTTEEGLRISQWAAETFGARGVLSSNQVSQYPLDAQAALVGEGAPEIQKKIVAEHIDDILDSL